MSGGVGNSRKSCIHALKSPPVQCFITCGHDFENGKLLPFVNLGKIGILLFDVSRVADDVSVLDGLSAWADTGETSGLGHVALFACQVWERPRSEHVSDFVNKYGDIVAENLLNAADRVWVYRAVVRISNILWGVVQVPRRYNIRWLTGFKQTKALFASPGP